ncbi:MAG TPA: hypothetical protein DD706_24470 [Nitrospiraceae bacterium]|nr:hypothetical protein [Nitrospiraceae bacterium]
MTNDKNLSQQDLFGDAFEKVLNAKKRLGPFSHTLLQWAVEFSQVNLREFSPQKLKDLQFEVFAFFISSGRKGNGIKAMKWSLSLEDGSIKPFPSKEQVISVQKKLFDTLVCSYKGHLTSIHLQDVTFELDPGFRSTTMKIIPRVNEIEGGVHLLFAILLSRHGPVGRCLGCQKYFVSAKGKKIFCTASCQENVASRRYRSRRKSAAID